MKLRITQKDLKELSLEQKQNLCDLWIPHVYDAAIANVCVDVAEERFAQITFIIGGIKLLKHHDMLLYDMKFMPDNMTLIKEEENYSDNIASDRIDGIDNEEELEDEEIDFSLDDDFNVEFQRPDSFLKDECLPLLDIGQMIDILERKNYGEGDFYLSASMGDYAIEMGKNGLNTNIYNDPNSKAAELCDILWESVKAVL